MENTLTQGSSEWHTLRKGKFTGSEIYKLMTEPRSKSELLSETAKTYVHEKIVEQFSTEPKLSITTAATEWGTTHEPAAKKWYGKVTGCKVQDIAFVELPNYEAHAGGSPDGLVDYTHIVEIKCPYVSANHVRNVLCSTSELRSTLKEYYWQMQFYMACLNVEHCDFVTFDPRIDADWGLHIKRIERNDADIALMLTQIDKALTYKQAVLETILNSNTWQLSTTRTAH